MPLLLIGTLVLLLTVGGGDRLSAWLMPGLPPPLGAMLLIAALLLVTALTLTSTRSLATSVVRALANALLMVLRALLTACLAALRVLWDRGRAAWRALRGAT